MGFRNGFNQFQKIGKLKVQRKCKGCNERIVVENANRKYCNNCRKTFMKKNANDD